MDFLARPQFRSCIECRVPFEYDGNKWKTHCPDCYKKHVRECKSCDRNLPITARKWQKECSECFKKRRSLTHGPCPLCPEEKKTHLRKPFGQPACDDCMKKMPQWFLSRPDLDASLVEKAAPVYHQFTRSDMEAFRKKYYDSKQEALRRSLLEERQLMEKEMKEDREKMEEILQAEREKALKEALVEKEMEKQMEKEMEKDAQEKEEEEEERIAARVLKKLKHMEEPPCAPP